jgi:uncharacterized protein YcbK (DUF882 family)
MRRLALVGVALGLSLTWATAPRAVLAASSKAEKALFGDGDSGPVEAEEAPPTHAPAAAPRKERRSAAATSAAGTSGKRGHHGGPAGRVVAEDNLRQGPLPPPSGKLHVLSVNTGDEAEVNLFNHDGSYDVAALAEINHVLRCRRTDDEKSIDPRLLTLLSHVYDHFGGKTIEVVSGYRNQRKQTSNHFKGTASDIRIEGVSVKKLSAFAETLDNGGMGIGQYPKAGFVHIDVRPPPSYRWIDSAPPNPNDANKRPPRGWKRKKLQS